MAFTRYWVGGTGTWDSSTATNWSATSGGSGGASAPANADTVIINASSGTGTITVAASAVSLNTTYNQTGLGLSLSGSPTLCTSAGTFTFTKGTITLNDFTLSTGNFNSDNTNTRSIAFGSGNIALTSTTASTTVLSMYDATNFSCTGTGGFTRNQAATATVVFGITGGSSTNAPNLTVNGGASTLTITSSSYFKNLNFTGSTCSINPSDAFTLIYMAGNLTLGSGSYSAMFPYFVASGTITSNGKNFGNLGIGVSGITVDLGDAFTCGLLQLSRGTFNTNNFSVTSDFYSNNTNTRTLNMGSSTWTTEDWTTYSTLTFNAGTSTINLSNYLGSSTTNFTGGGLTYYNLVQTSTNTANIYGSNTFNTISNTAQPATIRFEAGTTQTVSNFNVNGTAGNLVTISSSTAGSQATLSKTIGTVASNYLSVKDSNATGGAIWYAGANSTNVSNNTGWVFSSPGSFFIML